MIRSPEQPMKGDKQRMVAGNVSSHGSSLPATRSRPSKTSASRGSRRGSSPSGFHGSHLFHPHQNAALRRRQRPGDDRLQAVPGLRSRRVPAIGKPLLRVDREDFAIRHPVPMRHRRGRNVNLWPTTGWKSLAIGRSAISALWVRARQTFFRPMRQLPLKQHRTNQALFRH